MPPKRHHDDPEASVTSVTVESSTAEKEDKEEAARLTEINVSPDIATVLIVS